MDELSKGQYTEAQKMITSEIIKYEKTIELKLDNIVTDLEKRTKNSKEKFEKLQVGIGDLEKGIDKLNKSIIQIKLQQSWKISILTAIGSSVPIIVAIILNLI